MKSKLLILLTSLCMPCTAQEVSRYQLSMSPDVTVDDNMEEVVSKIVTWNIDQYKQSNPSFAKKVDSIEKKTQLDVSVKTKSYTFGTSGNLKERSIKSSLKFSKVQVEVRAELLNGLIFETLYKPCGLENECGIYYGHQISNKSYIGWKLEF